MRVFAFIFEAASYFIDAIVDIFDTLKYKQINFKWKIIFTLISIVLLIVWIEIIRRIWL